jgi:hypothetical protein
MAVFNTSQLPPIQANLVGASSFQVANITCVLVNTEYSYLLPSGTKKLKLRARGTARLQLADATGLTNTTFFTIHPGECYEDDMISATLTLFFQSSKAGEIVEIITWT